MLPRVLEPEVMDDEAEVAEYDAMPHDDVNARFVEDFLVRFPPGAIATATVLDLGTGTALIPLLLLQREPGLRVTAVDRSAAMLRMAARHACRFGQQERLDLVEADVCRLPFADRSFDMVLSNSLLHHLPEPVRCLRGYCVPEACCSCGICFVPRPMRTWNGWSRCMRGGKRKPSVNCCDNRCTPP